MRHQKKDNIPTSSRQHQIEASRNSANPTTLQALVRAVNRNRAETFLVEMLNLPDLIPADSGLKGRSRFAAEFNLRDSDLAAARRFCAKLPEFMPDHLPDPKQNVITNVQILHWYKAQLHEAWIQPTAIARQVFLLVPLSRMLKTLYEPLDASTENLPAEQVAAMHDYEKRLGNMAMAFLHALNIADRVRFCPNPECPAPHFIAKQRRQKYCSETCALPAQRAFKRAWWAEHGNEWQQKHRAKGRARKSQRKRRGGK